MFLLSKVVNAFGRKEGLVMHLTPLAGLLIEDGRLEFGSRVFH